MRFFFLLLSFFFTSLFAHVIQTDSLELLEKSIPDLNQHDLVIFDYDKTLLMVDDAFLQWCGKKCLNERIQAHDPTLTSQKVEELVSLILLQRQASLVDPHSLEIIRTLQNRGIKVFVLTALRTGKLGYIPKTEYWRLEELYNHGYDFRAAFPKINRLDFKEYRNRAHPPVFIQGLFCSGSVPKGEALNCFFKKISFRPRRIIFVDNATYHHDSVEKWARLLKIPYLGYFYTAALKKRKSVDEQIANFQIQFLIENNEWISDEEVKRRMKWSNIAT